MLLALASKKFINNNIDYNTKVIINSMEKAKSLNVDFICFGESFLQGFDCLNWNYEDDIKIAVTKENEYIMKILEKSKELNIGIMFGYIEKDKDIIYSSYIVIDSGSIIENYRRISKGWKEYTKTDNHYQEGDEVVPITINNIKIVLALCGDLWDYPDRFNLNQDLLIWPVYINYSIKKWENSEKEEYCLHAKNVCNNVLMINSLSDDPDAFGGCYHFKEGKITSELKMGSNGLLLISF